MKNISEILSCIKQYIYTFFFYFLRLFYSDCSHSLCHPSFGLSKAYSPSGKELNTSSQEDACFSGRCTLAGTLAGTRALHLTSSRAISFWDSATAHLPSGNELKPAYQEDARLSGHCTLACKFRSIQRHPSLGPSNSSVTLW